MMSHLDSASVVENALVNAVDALAEATPGGVDALNEVERIEMLCRQAIAQGMVDVAIREVEGAAALIDAYSEDWAPLALRADAHLDELSDLPVLHPAIRLWGAIAQSIDACEPPMEQSNVIQLQLPRVRLAAAVAAVPRDPPWVQLGIGEGWEIAFTEDQHGEPCFLIAGVNDARRVSFVLSDGIVLPQATPEGLSCAVRPGAWAIRVDGTVVEVRVS